jgi:hypothetical protein
MHLPSSIRTCFFLWRVLFSWMWHRVLWQMRTAFRRKPLPSSSEWNSSENECSALPWSIVKSVLECTHHIFGECPDNLKPRMIFCLFFFPEFVFTSYKGKAIPVTGRGGPWGCETSRLPYFSRQPAHRWRWGQPYSPAAICPPGRFLVFISVRGWVDPRAIVRMEGLRRLKYPVTAYEPATFRFVA